MYYCIEILNCQVTTVKHTSLFVVAAAERHRNVFHYGLGVRNRTAINDFGDHYVTVTLHRDCKLKTTPL